MTRARKPPVAPAEAAELYPIRTVSDLTGVNAITLRAWERRFGLIRPTRTAGGHRLYGREEIDLIHRIVGLLKKGLAISQVGRALVDKRAVRRVAREAHWNARREALVGAVGRFDLNAIEDAYLAALSVYPLDIVTDRLLLPALHRLGQRWANAEGSVAEEHFFSAYLRNKLGARFHHRAPATAGAVVIAACLPGEQHEIGLLLFSLRAFDAGVRPVVLAANTPLHELALVAQRTGARAIVLSGTVAPPAQALEFELPALVAAVRVPVFVGGMVSIRQRDAVVAAGAEAVGLDIAPALDRIRDALGHVSAAA